MSVPHDPPPTIFGRAIGVAGEKIRYLGLDRSRKQRTRALTQNFGERISKGPWVLIPGQAAHRSGMMSPTYSEIIPPGVPR